MSSMELFRPSHPSLLGSPGFLRSVFFSSTKTAFSPCGFHWIPSLSYSRIHLRVRVPRWLSRSAVNSSRNGSSSLTCKGLCKVLWTIDVDMEDGQLLFLTGDPISLGCWEPDMAILLSPSKDGANLWKTEIKLPCGIHFKYNYFMKGETQSSYDVIWRQGPDFSLSVPCIGQEEEVIKVRDSWIKSGMKVIKVRDSWIKSGMNRLPSVSWGSWLVEIDLPEHSKKLPSLQAASAGAFEMLRCPNGAPSDSKKTLHMAKDDHHSLEKVTTINAGSLQMEERDQPVEEPWLLRSILLSIADSGKLDETSNEGRAPKARHPGELSQDAEKFMHNDECKPNTDPTSTVILINSSVCTMQRIAILEEGQLVELLLEPVKNNVQCDSVYLGIITQFVPHMGGAFVDIGISRPSLMDIKPNREPFAYPPFSDKINSKVVNNSLSANANKEIGINEHDDAYTEDEMIDDELSEDDNENDAIQPIDDVYMEQEAEDDIDIPDALNMNGDNDAIHSGEDEAEFEEYLMETGHHIEDESSEDFSSEMDRSMDSDLSNLIEESLMSNDDMHKDESKWAHVCEGTKVIVQVVKEGLGTKGPALTAYPSLRSRFWILLTRCDRIGVAKKITGAERTRLRVIAKKLQPPGFGLTVRTVAAGHTLEELQKDLEGLLATWKGIVEHAKSAALAAEEGVDGAVPIMLHRAMGQTLSVVQDYFNEKVKSMVVDSPRTYHEVTSYLQEIAPDLCYRVELYDKKTPIFDDYGIEEEINNILGKRVPLSNGGSLVIEQTEALVSIDVNGGHGMLGQETSQEKAVLEVNLAAAKQIARELRLRDIGGIIVVDFIDMVDESHKRLVYEEVKKAVERDRSTVRVSELSKHGLMEITRKRVRPSVTFMISEPCTCCHATGRVEALETSFSKIEHEICRLLAASNQKPDPGNAKSWPRFVLRVDRHMCTYLTTGKRTKLAVLSSSLKVWILLKVARGFSRGTFEVKPFTDGQDNDEQQVSISRLRPAEARALIPNSKLTLFSVKKWKSRGK